MLFLAFLSRTREHRTDSDTFLWDPFSSLFDGNLKKGLWPGRSHYVSVTEPRSEKCSVLTSAQLWVSMRNDMHPDKLRKGWFACQIQVRLFVTSVNNVSNVFFFVFNDLSCFHTSTAHHLCLKEYARLRHKPPLVSHTDTTHFIFHDSHCLVECLANITAGGANAIDLRVQRSYLLPVTFPPHDLMTGCMH